MHIQNNLNRRPIPTKAESGIPSERTWHGDPKVRECGLSLLHAYIHFFLFQISRLDLFAQLKSLYIEKTATTYQNAFWRESVTYEEMSIG